MDPIMERLIAKIKADEAIEAERIKLLRPEPHQVNISEILSKLTEPKVWHRSPGIYLLYQLKEVIYIGQSVNVVSRIQNHIPIFQFDSALYYPELDQILRYEIEYALLHHFHPRENRDYTRKYNLIRRLLP